MMKVKEVREGLKKLYPERKKLNYDELVKAVDVLQKAKKKAKDSGMIEEDIVEILGELLTDDVYETVIDIKNSGTEEAIFLYDLKTYECRLYDLETYKFELACSETCDGNLNSVESGDSGVIHV